MRAWERASLQSVIATSHPRAAVFSGLKLSIPGLEAEVLSGVLKITQCAMVKRRSYWTIQQSVFVFLPSICHSHTTEASTPFENKVWELYSYKEVLSFFLHYFNRYIILQVMNNTIVGFLKTNYPSSFFLLLLLFLLLRLLFLAILFSQG